METSDSQLCLRCLEMLRSGEDSGYQRPIFDYVLFDQDTVHEISPKTCPVCATIEFATFDCQENISEVSCAFWSADRERYCELHISLGDYKTHRQLKILPADNVNESRRFTEIPASTVTEESIKFLKKELTTCFEQHESCRTPLGAPPTRLLRIERLQGNVEHVYLEDSEMSKSYKYTTLSHCWGGMQPMCLTKETEGPLRAGVNTQILPKTFRDAVAICFRLGFKYIWIDSLTIFQDNLQDWATEAAIMHSVYKNALLNLAANGAADGSVGLSFERNPLAFRPFYLDIGSANWVFPPDWPTSSIWEGPLTKRAWVLQERVLSTRIIHFTVAGALWQCMQHFASEAYPSDNGDDLGRFTDHNQLFQMAFSKLAMSKRAPFDVSNETEHRVCYNRWLGLLWEYSRCRLTKSEDKLVAIQGIAQTIKEVLGIELVCGMWKDLLIFELLWQRQACDRCTDPDPPHLLQWRAPSWSWANSDFPLEPSTYPSLHLTCPGFEEVAKIVKLDVNALASGQVSNASLILEGRYVQAKISAEGLIAEDHYGWLGLFASISCKDEDLRIGVRCLVFDRSPPLSYTDELTFIALARCHCKRECSDLYRPATETRPSIAALMLRRLPTTPLTYSRVGVLILESKDACDFYMKNQSAEEEELVLV